MKQVTRAAAASSAMPVAYALHLYLRLWLHWWLWLRLQQLVPGLVLVLVRLALLLASSECDSACAPTVPSRAAEGWRRALRRKRQLLRQPHRYQPLHHH